MTPKQLTDEAVALMLGLRLLPEGSAAYKRNSAILAEIGQDLPAALREAGDLMDAARRGDKIANATLDTIEPDMGEIDEGPDLTAAEEAALRERFEAAARSPQAAGTDLARSILFGTPQDAPAGSTAKPAGKPAKPAKGPKFNPRRGSATAQTWDCLVAMYAEARAPISRDAWYERTVTSYFKAGQKNPRGTFRDALRNLTTAKVLKEDLTGYVPRT